MQKQDPEFEQICLKYQRDVNCLIDQVLTLFTKFTLTRTGKLEDGP